MNGSILNVDQNILDLGENKLNITYLNIQILALFLLIFLFGSFSFPSSFFFCVKWQSLFLFKYNFMSGKIFLDWSHVKEKYKGPTCGKILGAYVIIIKIKFLIPIFSFLWMLGLSCLGFLHPCGHLILDMRATFLRGLVDFYFTHFLFPIFSTKHALVK